MARYCLTLDLKNDAQLIAEYEQFHQNIWPEVEQSIRQSGIETMEIYRLGTRLLMVMEVDSDFSFERKTKMDSTNPKVIEWEALMWRFQQPLAEAKMGEKWILMDKIFKL